MFPKIEKERIDPNLPYHQWVAAFIAMCERHDKFIESLQQKPITNLVIPAPNVAPPKLP